jgi:hypothetical protein
MLDHVDRMVAMLEGNRMDRLEAGGTSTHDVAEPAHHGPVGEPERRPVDRGVDDRVERRVELEQG